MEQTIKRFPSNDGGPTRAKLIERLKDGKIGEILTDAELTQVCGQETGCKGKGYPALLKAIRFVTRHHGVVWERIRDADAIRCLDPNGIVAASDRSSEHIRRTSKVTVQKLRTITLDNVEEADRPAILSRMAQHGTLAQFASVKTQKKLEARKATATVNPAKLLEAFK